MALMDFTEEMENVAVVFMGTGDQVSEFRSVLHKKGNHLFLAEISCRSGQKTKVKHNASVI